MPAVIREMVDNSAGHPPGAPRRVQTAGQSSVLVNNALAVVEGGTYEVIPPHPHPGSAASSATVFIEGKPVHRNGDAISCGDTASNGSHDVFAG